TGGTTVGSGADNGTLTLGAGGSLASTSGLTVKSGSFDIENGVGQTVGSLQGTGGSVSLGNGDLTVNQAATTAFAGTVTGAEGLNIEGGGTLALTNAGNNYAGGTAVTQSSTVEINTDGELGTGGLTLG